jgi:antitoxin component YwqK of YwqJK toxin-antitoxin module
MRRSIFVITLSLLVQISLAQNKIEKQIVLDKNKNGKTMREHIKFQGNDTIIEKIYFPNSQLNYKRQIFNDQRNGWSYTFTEKGKLLFLENYLDNKLTGITKAYYPSGKVSRVEYFRNNKHIDTADYFDENLQITMKVVYKNPCELGSKECNQVIYIYENGNKVYSYEVDNGLKSDNHKIYDQKVYLKLLQGELAVALPEKGMTIFQNNCGMCHRLDIQLIGPELNCITKKKNTDEISYIVNGGNGHPTSKLTEKEITAIIEYIKKNCP